MMPLHTCSLGVQTSLVVRPSLPSRPDSVVSHSLDLLVPAFPMDLLDSPSPPAAQFPANG
jgi:hypothetical protein